MRDKQSNQNAEQSSKVKRTRVPFNNAPDNSRNALTDKRRTEFLERDELLNNQYAYCVIPDHFFDRALLVRKASKDESPVLSFEGWDGRKIVSFHRT